MIKSTRNGYCDHIQSIRNLVLVLRIVESWDGWLAVVWEGRGGMGKKKKEKQRKKVSAEGVCI
jgi:hypothetical protein